MMTYQNLSTIGGTYVLETEGENGPEYWKGGMDFTSDISEAARWGVGNTQRFTEFLEKRCIRAKAVKVPGDYSVMHWPDLGWVVINHSVVETTVHRIRRVVSVDWFFTKDHNTTLVVKYPGDTDNHYQVGFKGELIDSVTHVIDGQTMNEFTMFNIPDDSNLKYMFEFESTPAEEMEVA